MEAWPHVMLDLETMGNRSDAAIVAIGAVAFDVERGLGPEFYRAVRLESSMQTGGSVSASTVMWWMRQSDDARAALSPEQTWPINAALIGFSEFVQEVWNGAKIILVAKGPPQVCVWGNGAAFDNVILRSAYEMCDLQPPWTFREDRCYRTLRSLAPDIKRPTILGTPHNALDDAKFQAVHAIEILRALSLSEK